MTGRQDELRARASERTTEQPRMSPLDRTFHETVLRLAKGIVNAYENWIKAHSS